ncbi:MAG: flagellar hook-basal body complex protein FliE [Candidatus Sumerlaeota bacterium]|nr:flagellar hook-basal body complex protein FliE [Candidatus Sumerlaeota bacterium]
MAIPVVNPQLRALLGPQFPKPELTPRGPAGAAGAPQGKSFAETLKESIAEVNQLQNDADQALEQFVTGQSPDVHGTMIALQKADLSFKVMMEVRNKLLSAYQEVMRIQ